MVDFIVGFPGETEEQFQETMTLLDEVPYEQLFAFKYSPRPFTKAIKYEDQLTEEEKSARLTALLDKHRAMSFDLVKRYEGQTEDVLVEGPDRKIEGNIIGRTTQNKLVHFAGSTSLIGTTVPVKITSAKPQTFLGERVLS